MEERRDRRPAVRAGVGAVWRKLRDQMSLELQRSLTRSHRRIRFIVPLQYHIAHAGLAERRQPPALIEPPRRDVDLVGIFALFPQIDRAVGMSRVWVDLQLELILDRGARFRSEIGAQRFDES